MSSRDRRAYFYAFYLPRKWWGAFAFCHKVPGHLMGRDTSTRLRIGARCPAMGWVSAVGVTQMAHRNMLLRARCKQIERPPYRSTTFIMSRVSHGPSPRGVILESTPKRRPMVPPAISKWGPMVKFLSGVKLWCRNPKIRMKARRASVSPRPQV